MNLIAFIFALAVVLGHAQEVPKDCLNLDSLVESLQGTKGQLQIDSVEVLPDHSLVDLASRFPRVFLADRSMAFVGQPYAWSAVAKSYRSGAQVSETFVKTVKRLLSVGPKDESPVYSAHSSAGGLISNLLIWHSVQLPYGYMSDNTFYEKALAQYECKNFYKPGIGYGSGGLKIVAHTATSLTYANSDSGEVFSVSVSRDDRVLRLTRLGYFTVKHNCGTGVAYEVHPVQVQYSVRWSADDVTPPPKTDLEVSTAVVANDVMCSEVETKEPPRPKQKYFFQTSDLAGRLALPIATLRAVFGDRDANVNASIAAQYTERRLARQLGSEMRLTANYRFKTLLMRDSDKRQPHFLSEMLEKGDHLLLDADVIAQFCAEEGNIANISADILRKHPELSCIFRTEVGYEYDRQSTSVRVAFSKWEPTLEVNSLPLSFAADFFAELETAVKAKSPGIYLPSPDRYQAGPFLYDISPQ